MIIVPQPQPQPTPLSRALTDRVRATIAEFQRREPRITPEEVAQALRDAMPSASTRTNPKPALIIAVLSGVMTAIGMGLVASSSSNAGRPVPVVPIVALAVAGLGVVAALILRSRNDR